MINKKNIILLVALYLLFFAFLGTSIFFVVSFFSFKNNIKNNESEITNINSEIGVLSKALPVSKKLDENLSLISKAFPMTPDVPAIMAQLEGVAKESSLNVERLSFIRSSAGSVSLSKETSEVSQVVVSGSFSGEIASLQKFLGLIERSIRIMGIHSIKVDSSISPNGEFSGFSMSLGFVSYFSPVKEVYPLKDNVGLDKDATNKFLEKLALFKYYPVK